MKPMANSLAQVYKNVSRCNSCGTLKSNSIGCNNCENNKKNLIKFVLLKILLINGALKIQSIYQGYFHILGGTISSPGQRKEDLLINSLVERVKKDDIEEVIISNERNCRRPNYSLLYSRQP